MKKITLLRPSGHEGASRYDGPRLAPEGELAALLSQSISAASARQIGNLVQMRPGAMSLLAEIRERQADAGLATALGRQAALEQVGPEQTILAEGTPVRAADYAADGWGYNQAGLVDTARAALSQVTFTPPGNPEELIDG